MGYRITWEAIEPMAWLTRRALGCALAAFGLALCLALAAPAPARAEPGTLELGYTVYLGGLNIFSFDANLELDGDAYKIYGGGKTRGLARWVWKWGVDAVARGRIENGSVEASTYDLAVQRKSEHKTLRLGFGANGTYTIVRNPADSSEEAKERRKRLPKSIPEAALDPLSAALRIARAVAGGKSCTGTVPIFDGNRRYDLTFSPIREERIGVADYSIFAGSALRCSFDMKRISGFRRQRIYLRFWDEDDLEPPQIWIARLSPSFPPVPVQFQADFNMGYMMIYLTKAEYRGRPLLAQVMDKNGKPKPAPAAPKPAPSPTPAR